MLACSRVRAAVVLALAWTAGCSGVGPGVNSLDFFSIAAMTSSGRPQKLWKTLWKLR